MMVHQLLVRERDSSREMSDEEACSYADIMGVPSCLLRVRQLGLQEAGQLQQIERLFCVPSWMDAARSRYVPWMVGSLPVRSNFKRSDHVFVVTKLLEEARSGEISERNLGPATETHTDPLPDGGWVMSGGHVISMERRIVRGRRGMWSSATYEAYELARKRFDFVRDLWTGNDHSLTVRSLFDYLGTQRPDLNEHWTHIPHDGSPPIRGVGLTMSNAMQGASDWHEALRNKVRLERSLAGQETVHTWDDGWSLARLSTPEHLRAETSFLGHCIGEGGYDGQVQSPKEWRFYSLRDKGGMPRVTFEVSLHGGKPCIQQAEGRRGVDPDGRVLLPALRAAYRISEDPEDWSWHLRERFKALPDDELREFVFSS